MREKRRRQKKKEIDRERETEKERERVVRKALKKKGTDCVLWVNVHREYSSE